MQLYGIVEIGEEIPGESGVFFGDVTRNMLWASAAERDRNLAEWREAYPLDTSNREFAGVNVIGLGLNLGLGLGQQGGVAVPSNALAQDDGVLITLDDGTQITVE